MIEIRPGLRLCKTALNRPAQENLRDEIREILCVAPLFQPAMPRTGKNFSVRMSNCGPLGWVSDRGGYRYQPHHPVTGAPWPAHPPNPVAALARSRGRSPRSRRLSHQFL